MFQTRGWQNQFYVLMGLVGRMNIYVNWLEVWGVTGSQNNASESWAKENTEELKRKVN